MRNWERGAHYSATVVRVLDGDTVDVRWIDPTLHRTGPYRIRLARIDAPELRPHPTPAAVAARLALQRLVLGQTVTVIPRRAWPDPYGRIIADIRVLGRDVALELIRDGFVSRYRRL